jgi:hypothetical protein
MIATLVAATCVVSQAPAVYYVATDGDDRWSGRHDAPQAGGSDGPFATLGRARDAVRALKREVGGGLSRPVTILIRGGRYELAAPLEFTPDDSGREQFPVVYEAYRSETPVFSVGRVIGGWRPGTVNGRA